MSFAFYLGIIPSFLW